MPSVDVFYDKIPKILSVKPTSRSVEVKLSFFDCTTTRGSLTIRVLATCSRSSYPSCNTNFGTAELDYFRGANIINITGLLPFSKYNLLLKPFWDSISSSEVDVRTSTFNTSADIPDAVTDVSIYSKNEKSISLRMKPLDQKNGILKWYWISYSHDIKTNFFTLPHVCDLWTNYHCITVDRLFPGRNFTLMVRSKIQN